MPLIDEDITLGKFVIPRLTGIDTFTTWNRYVTNYLREKECLRVLEGRITEPFRNQQAAVPDDAYAGYEPPCGPRADIPGDAGTSTTNADLNVEQMMLWNQWERLEAKCRATILMTVSPGIAAEVERKWCAADMYNHIKAEHRIDTVERRADLAHRIQLLRLPEGASRSTMLEHYERFTTLIADAINARMNIEEWDKCERFIFTLPKDLETVRIQWRILPSDRHSWRELVSLYKIIADERGLTLEREASINAIFNANNGKKNQSTGSKEGGQGRKGGKGEKGRGGGEAKKEDRPKKPKCKYCGFLGHEEKDCRKKANGDPSQADIREAAKEIRKKKKGGSVNATEGGDSTHDAAAAVFGHVTAVIETESIAGAGPIAAHVAEPTMSNQRTEFLIDSGATHHIAKDSTCLTNVEELPKPFPFKTAGKAMIYALHKGTLRIPLPGAPFIVHNVHLVPEASMNILSFGKLSAVGWHLDMPNLAFVHKSKRQVPLRIHGVLPWIQVEKAASSAAVIAPVEGPLPVDIATQEARANSKLYDLHCKLGHIHPNTIIELASSGRFDANADDLKAESFTLADCISCNKQKSTNLPKGGHSTRGTKEGEIIHVDIAGPFEPSSKGYIYYSAIVTDYTKIRQIIPLRSKAEAWNTVVQFITLFEKQSGIPVKVVRSDQGPEFGGGDNGSIIAKQFYTKSGIIHQESPRYTPELNGVVERFNRTIKEMLSAMIDGTPLGHRYWDAAGRYACAILNMTTYNEDGLNPWKMLTGRDPSPNNIREFGELITAMIPADIRKKSNFEQPRAELGRVIGMPAMASGWLICFESTGIERVSRDVKTANLPLSTPLQGTPITVQNAPVTVPRPIPTSHLPPVVKQMIRAAPASRQDRLIEQVNNPKTPIGWAAARARDLEATQSSSTSPNPSPMPAPAAPTTPHAEPSQPYVPDNLASREALILSVELDSDEPSSLKEAFAGPNANEWRKAVDAELESLSSKGTWIEEELPKGRKAIGCKWVLKRKRDADGNITKYKARLVAKGYSQQPGIDFEETYAPVSRLTTLRIFLSIVASLGLDCLQADAETAYLNGKLDRALYMRFPEGLKPSNPKNNILLLLKTIYGLKQSGRAWWIVLGDKLVEIGFERVESDWGLYIKRDDKGNVVALMIIYVDDMLAAARTRAEIDAIYAELGAEWTITNLGNVSTILGMMVRRDLTAKTLTLSQVGYIDKLTERFPVLGRTAGKYSPLPTTEVENDSPLLPSVSPYLEIVGSIQWIAGSTRPDVAFAASYLGRFNAVPTEAHYDLALRVVKYLVNTRNYGLELGGKADRGLVAYSDSDWAGCLTTRRSTTGYVSYFLGGAVSWISRRQATVSSSSMEAEYIAGAEASQDIAWLRTLLKEIGMPMHDPTVLYIDNQSAIRLADNPVAHGRSKHIDVKHHILRERVASKELAIEYIETKKQRADILTKPLSGPLHASHITFLRLVIIPESDSGEINAVSQVDSLLERIRRSNPLKARIGLTSTSARVLADRIAMQKEREKAMAKEKERRSAKEQKDQ